MAKKKRNRTELGREIAKLRIDFNETSSEMAEKIGMSTGNLFNIETGEATVQFDLVVKIKDLYGKDLEQIYLNGGGLSKITLDLDDLTVEQRKIALDLWRASQQDGETTAIYAEAVADPEPPKPEKKVSSFKPPPLPDDVAWLSEEDLANLDDI